MTLSYLYRGLERDDQIFSTGMKCHYSVVLCHCAIYRVTWCFGLGANPDCPHPSPSSPLGIPCSSWTNPSNILAAQWIYIGYTVDSTAYNYSKGGFTDSVEIIIFFPVLSASSWCHAIKICNLLYTQHSDNEKWAEAVMKGHKK